MSPKDIPNIALQVVYALACTAQGMATYKGLAFLIGHTDRATRAGAARAAELGLIQYTSFIVNSRRRTALLLTEQARNFLNEVRNGQSQNS